MSRATGVSIFNIKSVSSVLFLSLSAFIVAGAFAILSNGPAALARGDMSNNAVVKGGVFSVSEAQTAYKQADVKALYNQYGISPSAISSGKIQEGVVTKDGKVMIGTKVVATNAQTVGRQKLGGDKAIAAGGTTFYERPATTSIAGNQAAAFVLTDANGNFLAALIKDCGNPVRAVVVKEEKPIYSCDALTATPVSGSTTKYQFTVTGSASGGAKITGYAFGTGDGYGTKSSTNTVTYEYKNPGTYTAEASIIVDVNGKSQQVTSAKCQTPVKIAAPQKEVIQACDTTNKQIVTLDKGTDLGTRYSTNLADCQEKPVTPVKEYIQVCDLTTKKIVQIEKTSFDASKYSQTTADCEAKPTPPVLPATGPAELFTSGIGVASLAGATYYYRGSKRDLLNKWLGK